MKKISMMLMLFAFVATRFVFAKPITQTDAELILAAGIGDLDGVKTALSNGANINARNPQNGGTALMYAAGAGKYDTAQFLLSKGANTEIRTYEGMTAIFYAVYPAQNGDIIELLVRFNAKLNARSTRENQTPLGRAEALSAAGIGCGHLIDWLSVTLGAKR